MRPGIPGVRTPKYVCKLVESAGLVVNVHFHAPHPSLGARLAHFPIMVLVELHQTLRADGVPDLRPADAQTCWRVVEQLGAQVAPLLHTARKVLRFTHVDDEQRVWVLGVYLLQQINLRPAVLPALAVASALAQHVHLREPVILQQPVHQRTGGGFVLAYGCAEVQVRLRHVVVHHVQTLAAQVHLHGQRPTFRQADDKHLAIGGGPPRA